MIRAQNLCRHYGSQAAVRDLSFHVRRGEVVGLLGPNGAGKSTTMKMLTCFLPPTSGSATVAGIPLDEDSVSIRRHIGYLPENAPSYSDLNVRSHLLFMGRMHGMPLATLQDRIAELGRVCGLEAVMHRRIDELSKGYKQRVGLAASMLHDPDILILDEPTTGLDPNQIVEIRQLIRHLGEEKTLLLSSHVLPEVEAVCGRMMIIDRGELLADGSVTDLARRVQEGHRLTLVVRGDAKQVIEHLRRRLPEVICEEAESDEGARLLLCDPSSEGGLSEAAFHAVVEADAVMLEMRREQATLEDVFRRLTGGRS